MADADDTVIAGAEDQGATIAEDASQAQKDDKKDEANLEEKRKKAIGLFYNITELDKIIAAEVGRKGLDKLYKNFFLKISDMNQHLALLNVRSVAFLWYLLRPPSYWQYFFNKDSWKEASEQVSAIKEGEIGKIERIVEGIPVVDVMEMWSKVKKSYGATGPDFAEFLSQLGLAVDGLSEGKYLTAERKAILKPVEDQGVNIKKFIERRKVVGQDGKQSTKLFNVYDLDAMHKAWAKKVSVEETTSQKIEAPGYHDWLAGMGLTAKDLFEERYLRATSPNAKDLKDKVGSDVVLEQTEYTLPKEEAAVYDIEQLASQYNDKTKKELKAEAKDEKAAKKKLLDQIFWLTESDYLAYFGVSINSDFRDKDPILRLPDDTGERKDTELVILQNLGWLEADQTTIGAYCPDESIKDVKALRKYFNKNFVERRKLKSKDKSAAKKEGKQLTMDFIIFDELYAAHVKARAKKLKAENIISRAKLENIVLEDRYVLVSNAAAELTEYCITYGLDLGKSRTKRKIKTTIKVYDLVDIHGDAAVEGNKQVTETVYRSAKFEQFLTEFHLHRKDLLEDRYVPLYLLNRAKARGLQLKIIWYKLPKGKVTAAHQIHKTAKAMSADFEQAIEKRGAEDLDVPERLMDVLGITLMEADRRKVLSPQDYREQLKKTSAEVELTLKKYVSTEQYMYKIGETASIDDILMKANEDLTYLNEEIEKLSDGDDFSKYQEMVYNWHNLSRITYTHYILSDVRGIKRADEKTNGLVKLLMWHFREHAEKAADLADLLHDNLKQWTALFESVFKDLFGFDAKDVRKWSVSDWIKLRSLPDILWYDTQGWTIAAHNKLSDKHAYGKFKRHAVEIKDNIPELWYNLELALDLYTRLVAGFTILAKLELLRERLTKIPSLYLALIVYESDDVSYEVNGATKSKFPHMGYLGLYPKSNVPELSLSMFREYEAYNKEKIKSIPPKEMHEIIAAICLLSVMERRPALRYNGAREEMADANDKRLSELWAHCIQRLHEVTRTGTDDLVKTAVDVQQFYIKLYGAKHKFEPEEIERAMRMHEFIHSANRAIVPKDSKAKKDEIWPHSIIQRPNTDAVVLLMAARAYGKTGGSFAGLSQAISDDISATAGGIASRDAIIQSDLIDSGFTRIWGFLESSGYTEGGAGA
ncbi:MAG: hypothetical protein ABH829_00500 [archaeon]